MKKLYLPIIILISVIIFFPSLNVYFSSDDWFHLFISNAQNFREFLNFFGGLGSPQSASFYRPIPTQLFFFIFQKLFGLNPVPFHIFTLAIFILSIILVYRLANKLFNQNVANFSTLIYAFSGTNFTRIYFLSAFQEIVMVTFLLLSLLSYLNKKIIWSVIFFVLALMSKETAVVFPLILILIDFWKKQKRLKVWIIFFVLVLTYFIFYISNFGFQNDASYIWNFSPIRAINTLSWYLIWLLGAPEFLVDYVTHGVKLLDKFYTDFPLWSKFLEEVLILTMAAFLSLFLRIKKVGAKLLSALLGMILLPLLPVIFLPWHKFTLELTMSLVGFSILCGVLIDKANRWIGLTFITLFLVLNLLTLFLTYQTSYVISRAKIAYSMVSFLNQNYPVFPQGRYFIFTNARSESSADWGVSKQIAQATSNSDLFKVFYKNPNVEVYFDDLPQRRPIKLEPISISSLTILKNTQP